MNTRTILKGYGWLFLAAGAVFVLLTGPFTALLNIAAGILPLSRPLPDGGRSLWLGLTGSMMGMISYLAFSLSADPRQGLAWRTLMLSKALSTLLFLCFSLVQGNALFVAAAVVDAAILVHLGFLSLGFADLADPWVSRMAEAPDCLHEAWFLKANDPSSRNAVWLRHAIERTALGARGRLWYAVFDAKERRVLTGRWDEPRVEAAFAAPAPAPSGRLVCRMGDSVLATDSTSARGPDAEWRFSFRPSGGVPPFSFVPGWLHLWGLAGAAYAAPAPAAVFDGEIRVQGRTYRFSHAPGSCGHLWGRRKGESWRWAHAVFPGKDGGVEAVFEVLSARGRLGPLVLPRVTTAHCWRGGRHLSCGLGKGGRTWEEGKGWGFSLDFGGVTASGTCVPDEGMTAEFEYEDGDGRVLKCRNSKVGSMRLELEAADGDKTSFATPDTAAVETVERIR